MKDYLDKFRYYLENPRSHARVEAALAIEELRSGLVPMTDDVPQEIKKMNKKIAKLIGKVERSGYTLVPIDMHFKNGRIKIQIGLAKGKKQYDKRQVEKEKDWERDKARIMRSANKK